MALVTKLVDGWFSEHNTPGARRFVKKIGRKAVRAYSRSQIEAGLDEIIQDRVQDELDERNARWEKEHAWYKPDYHTDTGYQWDSDHEDWGSDYQDWNEKQAQMEWEMELGFVQLGADGFVCNDPHCDICER